MKGASPALSVRYNLFSSGNFTRHSQSPLDEFFMVIFQLRSSDLHECFLNTEDVTCDCRAKCIFVKLAIHSWKLQLAGLPNANMQNCLQSSCKARFCAEHACF